MPSGILRQVVPFELQMGTYRNTSRKVGEWTTGVRRRNWYKMLVSLKSWLVKGNRNGFRCWTLGHTKACPWALLRDHLASQRFHGAWAGIDGTRNQGKDNRVCLQTRKLIVEKLKSADPMSYRSWREETWRGEVGKCWISLHDQFWSTEDNDSQRDTFTINDVHGQYIGAWPYG